MKTEQKDRPVKDKIEILPIKGTPEDEAFLVSKTELEKAIAKACGIPKEYFKDTVINGMGIVKIKNLKPKRVLFEEVFKLNKNANKGMII